MRVNMNINSELLERLDNYAKRHYMSRSTVMCQACDDFLTPREISDLLSVIRNNEILKQFDDLSRLFDILSSNQS